jgi:menaquinone-dependent protoporphyrinogen oxidase
MDTTDAPPTSRRIAQVGLIALGASTWLAGLVAVGLISSRTDPIIGESAQNLVVTYVLLLPAFLWLGVHLRRRRERARTDTVDLALGRRRFLVDGAIFAGATAIGGAAARPLVVAASDPRTPTSMITDEHGTTGGPRVLVTYESQYGSTAEVADTIGRTVGGSGRRVDVRHVGDVDTVAEYDLVIVGGAIQYDNWMSGAADFVRAHRRQLATTTVAFFFTCLALSKPGESATRSADRYEQRIRAIAPELDPLGVGRFAGVLDYSRMTPVSRIFVRIRSTLTRRSAAGPCGPEIFRGALPRDLRRCAMRSTVHHRPSVQHSM